MILKNCVRKDNSKHYFHASARGGLRRRSTGYWKHNSKQYFHAGGGGGGEGGEQPLQGTVAEQRVGGEEEGGRGGQVGHLRWYTKQIQWCLEGSFDNDQDDLHHELKSKEPFAHYFLKKNERISETACYGKQVSFILDQV